MSAIVYDKVTKKIGNRTLIDQVSFTVEQGEIFGLLGPNGAGKTTLMKMTVGLLKISEGEIHILEDSISKDFCKAIGNVGALIEEPVFYPYMSGYDNLKIFAGMVKADKQQIEEVIRLVELGDAIRQKVKSYSLGMKQRLGIAVALLRNPKVLILDEPTNGLDPQGIMDLRDYLKRLVREKQVTVLVSSHMLSEMSLLCERFAIIEKGKMLKVITKEESERLSGTNWIQFDVEQTEQAQNVLKEYGETEVKEEKLFVHTNRERIAKCNESLVKEGIQVYGIRGTDRALEEYYFRIINGEEEDV